MMRNSADRLPGCLASLWPVVDEIVILDTGSEDKSPELARSLGARVLQAPWPEHFGQARNQLLDQLSQRTQGNKIWVLSLDLDESLSSSAQKLVRDLRQAPLEQSLWPLSAGTESGAASIPVLLARWPQSAEEAAHSPTMGYKACIFPLRPQLRFLGRVHEILYHPQQKLHWISHPQMVLQHRPQHWAQTPERRERDRQLIVRDLEHPDPLERFHAWRNWAQWVYFDRGLEAAEPHFKRAWALLDDLPAALREWGKPVIGALMQCAQQRGDTASCRHWLGEYRRVYGDGL